MQGRSRSPQRAAILRPVATLPVKQTRSTSPSTSAAPVAPSPVTTWRSAGSRPASSKRRFISRAMSGVTSEGLSTTALPASSAMNASPMGMTRGKFQGAMTPTTPRGT